MKLTYPDPDNVSTTIKNTALKYAFTYMVQEALRLRHNEEGEKFRNGEITEAQWWDFLKNWYDPRSMTVSDDLLELRQVIKDYAAQFSNKIDMENIPLGY